MLSKNSRLLLNVGKRLCMSGQKACASTDVSPFVYQDMLQVERKPDVEWKKLTGDYVSTFEVKGKKCLQVEPEALTMISEQAMIDIAHLLRPAHLQQLSNILKDPEASSNDKFVALELLKNASIAANMILPGCQDTGTAICMELLKNASIAANMILPGCQDTGTAICMELLKNASIAANMILPGCQDTGTAICMGKKGQYVWTEGDDAESLSRGVYNTYTKRNLRYSQVSPLDMYKEVNTKTNLPAQIEIYSVPGNQYDFMFIAKGGGSANKTFLYQQTKALLNPEKLLKFVDEKVKTLGTAACPPYHLALVIGGTSAEFTLKTVKLASTKYLDNLPTSGGSHGQAFRDLELEQEIHKLTQNMGIGAQFGGKYFCHDVRVVRLPRHGASCPVGLGVSCSADRQLTQNMGIGAQFGGKYFCHDVRVVRLPRHGASCPVGLGVSCSADRQLTQNMGIGAQFGGKYFCHDVRVVRLPRHGASCPVGLGVSCSADRQILGKITDEGVFLEQLETNPDKYLPEIQTKDLGEQVVEVNLNQPMSDVLNQLSNYPIRTRLSLTGTLIVARDIAHAKLQERLDKGEGLPDYFKNHPVYYAGPAKTPEGYASGSFGPTTAGRMDSYVEKFQAAGGSMVMLAKGNRSKQVTSACKKHGGFYLGSIGGPAAILAQNCIKKVEVMEYPELGMEAIWRCEVENFPAFIVVDDKGNDFFKEWQVE